MSTNRLYPTRPEQLLLQYCTLHLEGFGILIEEHKILDDTERRLYNTTTSKEQFVSMIYKTTKIRLLPEYEVYDSIFGKPKREKGESYKPELINKIKNLLAKDDITYSKIKDIILFIPFV